VSQHVEINCLAFPMTMALYDGVRLMGQRKIDCHVQAFSEVIDSMHGDVFEKNRMLRAIHLFEPEKITIKANDE